MVAVFRLPTEGFAACTRAVAGARISAPALQKAVLQANLHDCFDHLSAHTSQATFCGYSLRIFSGLH